MGLRRGGSAKYVIPLKIAADMSRQRGYGRYSGSAAGLGPLCPRKIAYGVIVRREEVIICKRQEEDFRGQGSGNREQGAGVRRAFEAVVLFLARCAVGRVRALGCLSGLNRLSLFKVPSMSSLASGEESTSARLRSLETGRHPSRNPSFWVLSSTRIDRGKPPV